MKSILITIFATVLICGLSVISYAEPTLNGPSGLILNPTADVATPESAWLGANYLDWGEGDNDSIIWTYTLTAGISQNFEMGAMGLYAQDTDDGFGLNAKYLLMVETDEMPGIAAGIIYSDIFDGQVTSIYVAASKYFMADDISTDRTVSLHGGVMYKTGDKIDNEWDFWGGMDFNLAENIIAIVEYSDDEAGIDGLVFGIRYFANESWTAQAGMVDGNLLIGSSYIF